MRRQQRKASSGDAAFIKLAVMLIGKRHVTSEWERDVLRCAVPEAFQSTVLFGPNLDNVLTTMTPRSRDLFFRNLRPLETGELTPISTMFQLMHLKMDRKLGSPTQKATISARAEKLAFAFVDQLGRIKLRKGGCYGGQPLLTASGPISVPSQYASGLKHLEEVLNYHSDAQGRAKLTADVTRKLLAHRIVHLPLLRFASAGSESGRALITESLKVIDEHGAGYESASRRRMHSELLKKLSTKSSNTSPVAKTSKLEVIFPLLEGTRSDRRIIHALPTPDATYLLTRHQDPKTQDWIVESARINGELTVPLSQHTVSKQAVDQFETRIRSISFQGMDRPRDFFELQLSSAFARLHDKQIFLPTAGGGILVFPLSGDTPFAIDESWGLSSNCIQAFDFAHDNLFVWVGIPGKEGALTHVDLARRKSRLLTSNQRERKAGPLDNFPGAKCSGVLYHGNPDKLYLLVSGILLDERNGLWSVDLRTGAFRPLLTGKFHIGTPRRQGSQLQFVKTGNVGGKMFRYLVTANLESATVTERKVTELPDSNASPLGNAGTVLVWSSFMAPYCVIEDRQDLDVFTRRSFLKLLPGEYLRHISLEEDGESVLLYSDRRGWKITLNELAVEP
ncbi:MAG: hypothetical protein O2983_08705 [Planctomycetota bacterium]|nr:hypothetical protein [Planctomycetota bacterium]MDA0922009.1 hypothetical protein [Planctomycetota bacterium]MDA1159676.1 hypothetical protein [Planctomycetota bacterium]